MAITEVPAQQTIHGTDCPFTALLPQSPNISKPELPMVEFFLVYELYRLVAHKFLDFVYRLATLAWLFIHSDQLPAAHNDFIQ